MIQMFVRPATTKRSRLELDDHDSRGMLLLDRPNDSAAANQPECAEERPQASFRTVTEPEATEAGAVDETIRAATSPAWAAFKAALAVFGLYIFAATLLAVVVFAPGSELLGFLFALAVMTFAGLPMLLATISVAAEDASAQSGFTVSVRLGALNKVKDF